MLRFEGGGSVWEPIEGLAACRCTEVTFEMSDQITARALALNPTRRMATAAEIARGVALLAIPASSFTTGTNLVIDDALTRGVQL